MAGIPRRIWNCSTRRPPARPWPPGAVADAQTAPVAVAVVVGAALFLNPTSSPRSIGALRRVEGNKKKIVV